MDNQHVLDQSRDQRIQEYLEEVLRERSPLMATLGVIAGNLMMMEGQLAKALQAALGESSDPLDDLDHLGRGMDIYLKVVRQIDRLSTLSQREPRQPAPGPARENSAS